MKTVQYCRRFTLVLILLSMLVAAGCDREEAVASYRAPKDPPPVAVAAAAKDAGGGALEWSVPAAWKQLPAQQMRFATFAVNDSQPSVELTVIPLGPESAALGPNVNRWEQQLGLPPSGEAELDKVVNHVDVNGLHADVVDLLGPESKTPRQRMLAAIVPHGGRVWFFKMSGPTDVVGAQKENFDSFIASLKPGAVSGQASDAAVTAPEASRIASYNAPEGWREIPNPQPPRMLGMQVGSGDQLAEMIITRFPPAGAGTLLDNINRWRGQIGLPAVKDAKSADMQQSAVGEKGAGIRIELENPEQKKRMIVVMPITANNLWFIKFTGPSDVIEDQSGAFESFLKSVEFGGESAGHSH